MQFEAPWRLDLPDAEPPAAGWPLLVGLHGYGDDGARLASRLVVPEDAPYARLWPDGMFPVEVADGDDRRIGRAWYQYDGDQARFAQALSRASGFVAALTETVAARHPVDLGRAALLGYSMGGYVAGWAVLGGRERWRALVALSTRIKAEGVDPACAAGLPILVLHGERDRFIPVERARESADRLGRGGAQVAFETWAGGHGLKSQVANRVDSFVREVFGLR